ncbi:hypothetical protein [Microbacterium terregens]|uniref:Uncharacterized protein n=1 Tax=Microbacterium terregens TaxID=69363 RepID=A0ABV5T464_9MICO
MSYDLSSTITSQTFERPEPRFSRRQLIKAGAWAAPVIVLAAAAPAAAASPTTITAAAIVASVPNARAVSPSTVTVDFASVSYNYTAWALTGEHNQTAGPATASVNWRVGLRNISDGSLYAYFPIGSANATSRTDAIAMYAAAEVGAASLTGVPAGEYQVVVEVVSVSYPASPVNGVAFASNGFTGNPVLVTIAQTPSPPPGPATTSLAIARVKKGEKAHNVTLTLSGDPGTVVNIGVGSWNVTWDAPMPPSATIGLNRTATASAVVRASFNYAGGFNLSLASDAKLSKSQFNEQVVPA